MLPHQAKLKLGCFSLIPSNANDLSGHSSWTKFTKIENLPNYQNSQNSPKLSKHAEFAQIYSPCWKSDDLHSYGRTHSPELPFSFFKSFDGVSFFKARGMICLKLNVLMYKLKCKCKYKIAHFKT